MSFQAMGWAVEQELPALQKLVLLMLSNCCNHHTGQCNPSHRKLAVECGMSLTSVKDAIKALEGRGLLEIIRKTQDGVSLPNQYVLKIGSVGRIAAEGESHGDRGWDALRQGVGRVAATKQEVETGIETTYTKSDRAKISIIFRKYTINANPAHPSVIALADQNVDLETLEAACKETREAKPNESISIAYVVKKLESWKQQASAVNVKGAMKKQDDWYRSDPGIERKASELGIYARPGESHKVLRERCEAEIRKREVVT